MEAKVKRSKLSLCNFGSFTRGRLYLISANCSFVLLNKQLATALVESAESKRKKIFASIIEYIIFIFHWSYYVIAKDSCSWSQRKS